MSYIALYRKWRPLVFEDVVEQEHVVKTLKYSISSDRIAHAYLFCGTRGTGKTTMAKIFSRAINCLNPIEGDPCNECEICKGILNGSLLDVIEIDAASNNSVDNIREIRDEVVYAPSQAKYKVYIIDEVHMLSSGAFNALLKTLEEPPKHVVFILATTEPHKLPATILSRCQRFDFRRITVESIMDRINSIAQKNGVELQLEASRLIARMADGALRDAISILDQCISLGSSEIAYNDVLSVVGIVNDTFIAEIVDKLGEADVPGILTLVERLVMDGKDISQFVSDIVQYYRNLLICKVTGKPEEIIEASEETFGRMFKQIKGLEKDEIIYCIKELSLLESNLKWAAHPRILLEVAFIKLCECRNTSDENDILGRLSLLEKKMSSGAFTQLPPEKNVKINTVFDTAAGVEKKKQESEESKISQTASVNKTKKTESNLSGVPIKGWDGILKELKNAGRMIVYTNLLETRAIELDDKFIGIVFPEGSDFKKMLVSKAENMETIEVVLKKSLGREVKIKCIEEGNIPDVKHEIRDEFVEKAQNLAMILNAPLNIIDE
ncbi:MAG: polymerase subunit gamma/tau [Clostridiales bacterium]|nr:polymerase subunit gamma/tau [Clostridiales bacterium]